MACMGDRRGAYWIWWGGLRERDRLEDHKGKDTIKLELQEVGLGRMDWIDLNQDKDSLWGLVNLVMKFQVP
jgi:hypothetical protein